MSEVMKEERERLVKYGEALQEIALKVLPIFDGLVVLTMKTAKQLVGAQQEVADIRREARVAHLKSLIQGGATPADAANVVLREMELAHEGSKLLDVVLQVGPGLLQEIPSLLAQWAIARSAISQAGSLETPEA